MAAATIAKVAKAAGASDEEVLQKASVAMPVLASAKGMLRNMAIAALLFIGERLAESAYEWATDSAPVTKGELHEVVRDAVAQAMEARDAAASNAGIEELERLRAASEQRPQLKLSPNITISHATMERLQRDAMARYRKSSGATERGE
ncbi:hypothetical protein [Ramlibacter sp.]|uniref:hypothetical protein n=1 Tax=Ramlibacter sp. TaxID=1917967 RepID=UPI003D0F03EA